MAKVKAFLLKSQEGDSPRLAIRITQGPSPADKTGGIHQDRAMDKNSIASSWVKGGVSNWMIGPKYKEKSWEIMGCLLGVEIGCYVFS